MTSETCLTKRKHVVHRVIDEKTIGDEKPTKNGDGHTASDKLLEANDVMMSDTKC